MPLQTNTSLIGENRYYETIKNLLNKKYGNKRQTAKAERTMLKYESLSNAKKEEINKILKTKPSLKPTRKEIALRKKISKINRASNYLIKREAVQNYLAMKNELRELITAKTNVNDPKMQKLVAQILILKNQILQNHNIAKDSSGVGNIRYVLRDREFQNSSSTYA